MQTQTEINRRQPTRHFALSLSKSSGRPVQQGAIRQARRQKESRIFCTATALGFSDASASAEKSSKPPDRWLDAPLFSSPVRPWQSAMVAGRWVIQDHLHGQQDAVAAKFEAAMAALRQAD